eukprot:1412983-Amphidinium_carterae.2
MLVELLEFSRNPSLWAGFLVLFELVHGATDETSGQCRAWGRRVRRDREVGEEVLQGAGPRGVPLLGPVISKSGHDNIRV